MPSDYVGGWDKVECACVTQCRVDCPDTQGTGVVREGGLGEGGEGGQEQLIVSILARLPALGDVPNYICTVSQVKGVGEVMVCSETREGEGGLL